jgi:hypothetical protein
MATGSTYLTATQVVVTGTNSSNLATDIMTFTIPSAGTWVVEYFVTMSSLNTAGQAYAGIYNSGNTLVTNSQITAPQASGLTAATVKGTVLIATTMATTFKIKGWQTGTSYTVAQGAAGAVYVTDTGIQGPAGPAGAAGSAGAKGDKGLTGDRGLTGATGATGATGPAGAKGDKGLTGDRGLTGATGLTGTVGPVGPAGATGAKGDRGYDGAKGATGTAGAAGAKGDTGAKGDAGPRGYDGAKGSTGLTGPAGPAGPTGAKGDTGRNATVYIQTTAPDNSVGATGDIWYQY